MRHTRLWQTIGDQGAADLGAGPRSPTDHFPSSAGGCRVPGRPRRLPARPASVFHSITADFTGTALIAAVCIDNVQWYECLVISPFFPAGGVSLREK